MIHNLLLRTVRVCGKQCSIPGSSIDTPIAILWTGEEGSDQIQVMICLENGDKISLEDADVQAIIASINISK